MYRWGGWGEEPHVSPAASTGAQTGTTGGVAVAPIRRTCIPKPGTTEKRGLGIPVMADRACQALVKPALEPGWEAWFEPNSYGFRPGRAVHDAMKAIFNAICLKPKYVLDADIEKCFDRINHDALLIKLKTFSVVEQLVRDCSKRAS